MKEYLKALEHCYKKVYKSALEKELKHRNELEKLRKEKGWEIYPYSKTAEAKSALNARYLCLKGEY